MGSKAFQTDPATSARMRRVRQRDTAAEIVVRHWLWRRGVRYSTKNSDLPGSPDIANRRRKWAIFVHGCFWHGHAGCGRSGLPKRNTAAWREKIEANKRRDSGKEAALRGLGYRVVIVWECNAERLDADRKASRSLLMLLPRLRPVAQ